MRKKLRSEKEWEEMLHRHRCVARKRQILLAQIDAEIPYYPFSVSAYTTKERRQSMWNMFKNVIIELRP